MIGFDGKITANVLPVSEFENQTSRVLYAKIKLYP